MKLTINIESDNAAFDDGYGGSQETARILRGLATKIMHGADGTIPLYDENGNKVGTAEYEATETDEESEDA